MGLELMPEGPPWKAAMWPRIAAGEQALMQMVWKEGGIN